MKRLKVGVIGVGYLGRFHAEKYASLPNVELVSVSDCDAARAEEVANGLNTSACTDFTSLIGRVEAVSIVVPTVMHYTVAKQCLAAGMHVLLEKPITATIEQADELIDLAEQKGVVLQIGHIERFNPAITAVMSRLDSPRYMTAERSAPFTIRCTDVSVVHDLMIHDIDIVMELAGADPVELSAAGASVITEEIDAAAARIVFSNGCVADVAANRISEEKKRVLRIFDRDALYTSDFQAQKAWVSRRRDGSVCELAAHEIPTERRDTLMEEIKSFIESIEKGTPPAVSGRDGRRALALAHRIVENIKKGIAGFVPLA